MCSVFKIFGFAQRSQSLSQRVEKERPDPRYPRHPRLDPIDGQKRRHEMFFSDRILTIENVNQAADGLSVYCVLHYRAPV